MTDKIYIVGDRFSELAEFPEVFTFSDFFQKKELLKTCKDIHVCQGVDHDELKMIAGLGYNVTERISERVDKKLAHKWKDDNVLITKPEKKDDRIYEAALVINDECAEMSDHVTGKHIQGLLLIEAARQMFMATTELYDLDDEKRGGYSYVLNNLNITFNAFLFPFDVRIILTVLYKEWKKDQLFKSVSVEFLQKDTTGCEVKASGTGFPKKMLAIIETSKAVSMRSQNAII